MKYTTLKKNPEVLNMIANWYYEEWDNKVPGRTIEFVINNLNNSLRSQSVQNVIIAKDRNDYIGAAEIKIREMDIYPEKEFWIGGVYVKESYRGCGIASKLVKKTLNYAQLYGVKRIYLQTNNLDGGLYKRVGFFPINYVKYNGGDVVIMEAKLS